MLGLACRGDGGDTNAAYDARETVETEMMLPFDPDLPIRYSPDGQSALTIEDNHIDQVKRLYQVNEPKGCMEETRCWRLQRKTGQLEIWNNITNRQRMDEPA